MTSFQLFIVGTIFFSVAASLALAKKYGSLFNHSQRMVITMFIGTSIGLCIGMFFAFILPGNMYLSTMLGLSAGAFLGGLCGWNLGVVAGLEGLISALMGGMMGAMLGEMLTYSESLLIINFSLSLSVCSLILYPVFKNLSSPDSVIYSYKWLLKPLVVFLIVLCFLLAGSVLNDEPVDDINHHQQHSS
ncbi:hypothetical protein [Halobacillus litoralis]|uniref:hypothetical protein n=1 Tax=Halobacillus litoralis TaxID=45668 RepID=UPI0024932FF5|nr:hypothetical protein [Halobacillus litoralis]